MIVKMVRLCKFYLWILLLYFGFVNAYIPTTFIGGDPHNIYAPPCLSDVHRERGACSPWQGHVRTNLFSFANSESWQACGMAMQGYLHMDRLLDGLYGQVYIPLLLTHDKYYRWDWKTTRYLTSASVADIPFLIGWNVINKKRFHLSGYAFGIIPEKKYQLFFHRKIRQYAGLDNHFAWGFGAESVFRLWGKPRHHIDLLADADITFLESRTMTVEKPLISRDWGNDYGISGDLLKRDVLTIEYCKLKCYPVQHYKGSLVLAHQFKNFFSDVGAQCFYYSHAKASFSGYGIPSIFFGSLFCDVGRVMRFGKLPSYVSLGAQLIPGIENLLCESLSVNLKLGVDF